MKNRKKNTKLRILLGACLILAAVVFASLLKGFTGPESLLWQRGVYILAVLGTGLAGLLSLLLGLWGLLMGFGLVLLIMLPQLLPDPWNRYFAVVYLAALLALPLIRKKQQQRRQAEEPPPVPEKTHPPAATEMNTLFVQQPSTGRVFQLILRSGEVRAYRVGGELRGVDESLIQLVAGPLRPLGEKDFSIPLDSIRRVRCKELDNSNAGYDCCVSVKTDRKNYRFAPIALSGSDDFLAFWGRLAPDDPDFPGGRPREEGPGPDVRRLEWLKKVRLGCCVYLAAVSLCWLFLNVPYTLFSVLAMLALPVMLVLYFRFPDELTILGTTRSSTKLDLGIPLLFSGMALFLRTLLDFNILNWPRLLVLSLGLLVILLVIFLPLSREWRTRKSALFVLVFALLFYAPGTVGQVNAVFDFTEPRCETASITEMHISTSSKSPDSYNIAVELENGETLELKISQEDYEALAVGDTVTVRTFEGLLGIPYAYAN